MAWFFMGALALAAFDAFEAIYSDPAPTASSEISTDAVMTGAREGTSPPPAGQ
jgi:hypothetical protein